MTKAERFAELQHRRAAALAARLDGLLALDGSERALDVGAGTGALAYALAPRVRSVVALDADAQMAERARAGAPANVEVVVADGEQLPFDDASFDVSGTLRTLHHTPDPSALVSELARVTRAGGTVLVVDQVAPEDAAGAAALNAFERARDSSTTRLLELTTLRGLLGAAGLRVEEEVVDREPRELESYLDLAGCEGAARDAARALAPPRYEAVLAWLVSTRP